MTNENNVFDSLARRNKRHSLLVAIRYLFAFVGHFIHFVCSASIFYVMMSIGVL